MASEVMIFDYFFTNLAFQLQWQPITFRGLDKNDMFGWVYFCKSFVKIPAVR